MNLTVNRIRLHIGMRNVKTGLAVFTCLLIYHFIGRDGYFLACTSAIICLQDTVEKSVSSGINRLYGTAFGAFLGMGILYLDRLVFSVDTSIVSATLGVMLLILFCNVVHKTDAIVIGCVVLLVIVLQQTSESPFVYSVNRLIDTFFGIVVAIMINRFVLKPPPQPEEEEPSPDAEAAPVPVEPVNTPIQMDDTK